MDISSSLSTFLLKDLTSASGTLEDLRSMWSSPDSPIDIKRAYSEVFLSLTHKSSIKDL